jgi:hypothetical protein
VSGPAATLEPGRPPGCLSELALERLRLGESSDVEGRTHLAGCSRCGALLAALADGAATLPPRRVTAPRRSRWPSLVGAALAMAAAVAIVAWVPKPEGEGTRRKGGAGAVRLGFFVRHDGGVRRGGDGERVVPGDALRFTVSAAASGWLAVVSRDGADQISVYYPTGGATLAPLDAGAEVALPGSTILDGVTGRERICAVVCPLPLPLDRVRVFARGEPLPEGCASDCATIEKQAGAQ